MAPVMFGLAFIYLPILLVTFFSFNESRLVTIWAGFSLKWYGLLFDNAQLLPSPWLSFRLAFLLLFVAIGLPRGCFTLFLAHTTFGMCFVATTVQARLSGIDTSLEDASRDLGASPRQTFWRITLPLILPTVVSSWSLAFVLSFDDLIISSLVSGPGAMTLPMRLYSQVRLGVTPEVNAASTLIVLAATTVLAMGVWAGGRSSQKSKEPP